MPRDHVVELDLGVVPEAAISGAVLVQTELSAFLTFNAMREGDDGLRANAGTAVVELVRCWKTRFGHPNDEARPGHPLGKAIDGYAAYEVKESSWIEEVVRQNRVKFPATSSEGMRHFVFTFHESTLECIAADLNIQVSKRPYAETFAELAARVVAE